MRYAIMDEDGKFWIVTAKDKRDALDKAVCNGFPKPYFGSYYHGHEEECMQFYEVVKEID